MIATLCQLIILLLSLAMLSACAATDRAGPEDQSSSRVVLLGFESCPTTPIMHERLRAALQQLEAEEIVTYIDQEALAADDLRRGYPAPTVLVNGRDLFGAPPPESPSLSCRVYQGPDGIPSVYQLAQRLSASGIGGEVNQQ